MQEREMGGEAGWGFNRNGTSENNIEGNENNDLFPSLPLILIPSPPFSFISPSLAGLWSLGLTY